MNVASNTPPREYFDNLSRLSGIAKADLAPQRSPDTYDARFLAHALFRLRGEYFEQPVCAWQDQETGYPVLDRTRRAIETNSLVGSANQEPFSMFCEKSETLLIDDLSNEWDGLSDPNTLIPPTVVIDTENGDTPIGVIKHTGDQTLYVSATQNTDHLRQYNLCSGFFYEIPNDVCLDLEQRIPLQDLVSHINDLNLRIAAPNGRGEQRYSPILGRISMFTVAPKIRKSMSVRTLQTEQEVAGMINTLNQQVIDHAPKTVA